MNNLGVLKKLATDNRSQRGSIKQNLCFSETQAIIHISTGKMKWLCFTVEKNFNSLGKCKTFVFQKNTIYTFFDDLLYAGLPYHPLFSDWLLFGGTFFTVKKYCNLLNLFKLSSPSIENYFSSQRNCGFSVNTCYCF